ncbi:bacteriophage N4 adsorption protein A [Paraburkholderia sp. C35]|uniref:NfrA family protein n=1 Tax=Paraburkholderia sp. C35 TaxID=2126993 RepID=UPI000D68D4C9|nr:bacteriophage N4 adsorption protein A [Paraburkholderia sp. C35]
MKRRIEFNAPCHRFAFRPRVSVAACLIAGVFAWHAHAAFADEVLPLSLSGAAYRVAQQAYAAYGEHRYAESVSLAREAIRQRPDVAELRILLANALAADGHRDDALRSLTDAMRELGPQASLIRRREQIAAGDDGGASDLPGAAGVAARAAYRAYAGKDYDTAASEAKRAIALAPEVARLRYLLIDALSASGRDDAAYAADQDAASKFGDTAALRSRRMFIGARLAPNISTAAYDARQRGDLADAERLAREAIAYAPDRRNFRTQLFDVLIARNDMVGLEQAATQAIAQDDTDVLAWTLRGYARAARGESGADADFAHALDVPRDPQSNEADNASTTRDARVARTIIADTWLSEGRPKAALDVLAPLRPEHDDTDDAIALRRLRAQRAFTAQALHVDTLAKPVFDCHADAFGASCDLYAADPGFEAMRTARAATQRGDHRAAVLALRQAVAAVPDDPQRRIALIDALVADGDAAQARREARTLLASGMTNGMAPLQTAYLAQRAGDGKLAYTSFEQADREGSLPASAAGDAGYAALAAHHDEAGAAWLERAIDNGTMTPQALLDAQQAHADATRKWGFNVTLNYRGSGIANGLSTNPTPGLSNNWQAGTEAYWRPFGSLGERAFEVYARGYENFGVKGDSPSGVTTLQAALGARVKPFASTNAIFAFERIFPIGSSVRGDWLARAAWSGGFGTERRLDVPSWWTGIVYGEAGHYVQHPSSYATANARFGRTFRVDAVDPRLTVFPHLVAGADYDSSIDHSVPVGVGAGVSARFWFRGGPYDAPRSFVDVSVQYRVRVAGDSRARGVFFGAVYSY